MRQGAGPMTASSTSGGGTIRGLRGPGGILLHSPELSRHTRPLNRYLRHGLGGRVRELAILSTARELDSQFEWATHEPVALGEGISQEIIEIIKHRRGTNGLDEADAIVIELGREILAPGRWRRRLSPGHYDSLAAALWSISSPLWAITLGRLHFSPPSTCSSTQVSRRLCRHDEPARCASLLEPHSLGSSRSIARFRRIPCLSGLNSQPASS
jgi:hypothetical protein